MAAEDAQRQRAMMQDEAYQRVQNAVWQSGHADVNPPPRERLPEEKFMAALNDHQQAMLEAVRDQLYRHLPTGIAGSIGGAIRSALAEVREYHWRNDEKACETWAYELIFRFPGDSTDVIFEKRYTLNKIVTDKPLNDGTYAIPYSNILGAILLTDDEIALLATAL